MKFKLTLTLLVILGLGAGAATYLLAKDEDTHEEHAHHDDDDSHDDHGMPSGSVAKEDHADGNHDEEMATTISAEAAEHAGLKVTIAGPALIRTTLPVYGQIKLNADRVARAVPRFGGIVRETRVSLGDTVKTGESGLDRL